MWGKWFEKFGENDEVFVGCAGLVEFVDVFHEGGHCGIEAVAVDIFGDLFDDFVSDDGRFSRIPLGRGFCEIFTENKVPTAVEEAIDTADRAGIPGGVELDGANEHFVGAESVSTVAIINDIEWVDDITFRFTHFFAIWGVDVAVINQLFDGFAEWEIAFISKELTPKANI